MPEEKVSTTIDDLLSLRYHLVVRELPPEEGGGWYGEVLELPGCTTVGPTAAETLKDLEEVKRHWLRIARNLGRSIPMPAPDEYSGRLTLRLPKWLHRRLALRARMQKTSLNSLITSELCRAVIQSDEAHAVHTMAVRLLQDLNRREWAHARFHAPLAQTWWPEMIQ
jgi:predicted RNase H-like HicB family nuclease